MIIYKVQDETYVSREDTLKSQLEYREKYFIPDGTSRGYRRMGALIVNCGENGWIVKEMGYSDLEINKMPVVGDVEYSELTAVIAKVVLEHVVKENNNDSLHRP